MSSGSTYASRCAKIHRNWSSKRASSGEVQPAAVGALRDLLAAGEAVREHERLLRRGAHRGEDPALARRDRDLVRRAALEAEGAGHPAAARVGALDVEPHPPEHRELGVEPHDGVVVAVALQHRPRREARDGDVVLLEELGEHERRAGDARGARVVREEVAELVAEHRDAGRLDPDDA